MVSSLEGLDAREDLPRRARSQFPHTSVCLSRGLRCMVSEPSRSLYIRPGARSCDDILCRLREGFAMPGLTAFGVFHTAIGVIALIYGFIALVPDKEITAASVRPMPWRRSLS